MAKNILLFSDGTGNSSAKLFRTNVWRLYDALDLSQPDQIAFYDNGVGTSSFKPYALLGGAIGLGLKRNVKDIYAFLSRNFEDGDRVYGFGFSRGAFTMRILIELVHSQGLASGSTSRDLDADVVRKWTRYRKNRHTRFMRQVHRRREVERRHSGPANPRVVFEFVGLFDTVAAYGLPVDELTRAWDTFVWPLTMSDRVPRSSIKKAFHALSLDDERQSFLPVLWTETHEPQNETSNHLDRERISQVWFAGVHSNVGGGYSDDSLSYVPLQWIMNEAVNRGVRFHEPDVQRVNAVASANAPINDSRAGLAAYYRLQPRRIDRLSDDRFHEVSIARTKIHESVFARIRSGDDQYAPIVLPAEYAVVQPGGTIVDGPSSTVAAESRQRAAARSAKQERVWNLVWKRRVAYFSTLLPSLFLALFPLFFKPGLGNVCLSNALCFLSTPIGWLDAIVPAFADRWIHAYQSHPAPFAAGAIALAAMLWLSSTIKARTKDAMRAIWQQPEPPAESPAESPAATAATTAAVAMRGQLGLIGHLRTSAAYQGAWHVATRVIMPAVFAVCIYFIAIALISRLEYSTVSAAGAGCKSSTPEIVVDAPVTFTFKTNDQCAASGYTLEAGRHYSVVMSQMTPWRDATIAMDLQGNAVHGDQPWFMGIVVPFRRAILQPWFKPIARLDARGNDEYPLDALPESTPDELRSVVHARKTGELFMYVNDAVWLWPFLGQYRNNSGIATVTVTPILPRAAAN